MTRVVWKYQLDRFSMSADIEVPNGSRIVHVGMQKDRITLWIELDPNSKDLIKRRFYAIGTGHPVGEWLQHIGTTQDGAFVWHVYAEKARREEE